MISVPADGKLFFERIRYLSESDQARVSAALDYARAMHGDELRKDGTPFVTHPLTVAYYLAKYTVDADALVAALLHDTAEDTSASVADITMLFGWEAAQIVDGVTKFEQSAEDIQNNGKLDPKEKSAETHKKLLTYMTRDVRVVLIKLFDRLHNMRTIKSMKYSSQVRSATETLDVYAPLANRLAMYKLKNELESLAFSVLSPEIYTEINRQLIVREREQRQLVNDVIGRLRIALEEAGIDATLCRSPRNVYTIYKNRDPSRRRKQLVDDVPRLVISVDARLACYTAVGVAHALWKPQPDAFDDYVARPRDNMYRALHTTLLHESGQLVKLRFRSRAMSILSNIGVLGRWASQEDFSAEMRHELDEQVTSLLIGISQSIVEDNPRMAVDSFRKDYLSKQITAITPNGDIKELPSGATPLDFAYKIHTDIGDSCHRAVVNGQPQPLNTPLRDGDRVQIYHGQDKHPQHIWLEDDLGFLGTSYARNHIRRWFRRLSGGEAVQMGHELLTAELALIGLSDYEHLEIASVMGKESETDLYQAIGHAEILTTEVARRILARIWEQGRRRLIGAEVTSEEGETFIILNTSHLAEPLHLCKNCKPRPGDDIRGYIRPNRRIVTHRLDCSQLPADAQAYQLLHVLWGQDTIGEVREVCVSIDVYDRPNLIFEISSLLHRETINIRSIETPRHQGDIRVDLCVEVASPKQLVNILHRIKSLVNVRSVCSIPKPSSRTHTLHGDFEGQN